MNQDCDKSMYHLEDIWKDSWWHGDLAILLRQLIDEIDLDQWSRDKSWWTRGKLMKWKWKW